MIRGCSAIALPLVVTAAAACSDASGAAGESPLDAAPDAAPAATEERRDPHRGHRHGTVDAGADPEAPLGPSCDEDNPVTGSVEASGSIDKELPEAVVQFERRLAWGCLHREYHDARQWDYVMTFPDNADRKAYALKMGWARAAIQEGAPGSGIDFLAMHRAMVGTLRDRFPAHAALFDGWKTPPTQPTDADPLPKTADGSAPPAFWTSMVNAIARVETNPASFASEDDFGRYVETQYRPTAEDPFARSTERGSGVHTYLHVRFDDPRSPIRMQRFSRNLEGEIFFRVHGWVDRVWTDFRKARGLVDANDAAYLSAMKHACEHMGLGAWSIERHACM